MAGARLVAALLRARPARIRAAHQLVEIGQVFPPTAADFPAGQFFLHRQLGYRGVVAHSWRASMYTYPPVPVRFLDSSDSDFVTPKLLDVASATTTQHSYYYALCDLRDIIANQSRHSVHAVSHPSEEGYADFVSHDDIIPFSPTSTTDFEHFLYDPMFSNNPKQEEGSSTGRKRRSAGQYDHGRLLDHMQAWNADILKHSNVFRATTGSIQVTVIPFLVAQVHLQQAYTQWLYQVLIENQGSQPVQLLKRSWLIKDKEDQTQTVSGPGVVGLTPVLTGAKSSIQYISSTALPTLCGLMGGNYTFAEVDQNGERGRLFECAIPTFILESPPVPS
eukprot:m.412185 g.412185  ORF g.412185 m.412185 type:complete len:334 (+) comp56565_c0_seq4:955-1956(+)